MRNKYIHEDWYYPMNDRHKEPSYKVPPGDPVLERPTTPIRLAHIDTGFGGHPCVSDRFSESKTISFYEEKAKYANSFSVCPRQGFGELLSEEQLLRSQFSDHGLATGAFIIGKPTNLPDGESLPLHGMCSHLGRIQDYIDFIPMRVMGSVNLSEDSCERLVKAVKWAIDNDCKVISMSFGMYRPKPFYEVSKDLIGRLRGAFEAARNAGVILCCASGQGVPKMMYPAKLALEDLCISCGPSTQKGVPWTNAKQAQDSNEVVSPSPIWSQFEANYITICAPGTKMPKAYWKKTGRFVAYYKAGLMKSEGSSYSTAFVAAIAALWYGQLERNLELRATYQSHEIMSVFKRFLQETATSWKDNSPLNPYGPGIINPARLLDTVLRHGEEATQRVV
jgi:hypothetical protein